MEGLIAGGKQGNQRLLFVKAPIAEVLPAPSPALWWVNTQFDKFAIFKDCSLLWRCRWVSSSNLNFKLLFHPRNLLRFSSYKNESFHLRSSLPAAFNAVHAEMFLLHLPGRREMEF